MNVVLELMDKAFGAALHSKPMILVNSTGECSAFEMIAEDN